MSDKTSIAVAPKHMGFMFLAKRPCGKVSAAAWDNPDRAAALEKTKANWIARGDTVERIERFVGDPEPEWTCQQGCRKCHETPSSGATT